MSHRFTFILLRQFPATHFVNKHLLVIINSYHLFYSTKIGWNAESDSYTERQSNGRVSYDSTPIKGHCAKRNERQFSVILTCWCAKGNAKEVFSHNDSISDIVIALSSIVPRVLFKMYTRAPHAFLGKLPIFSDTIFSDKIELTKCLRFC